MEKLTRTHYCGQVGENDKTKAATFMGWVNTSRDMGGIIFIDLRDKTGVVQVVFDLADFTAEEYNKIESLRSEDVIGVKGIVRQRDEETYNPRIPTGTVELKAEEFVIYSKSKPLPFPIQENTDVNEELRLKHRYLDLRRNKMYKNFKLRAKTVRSIRNYLEDLDFMDVETPILTKSTPEGARDYLVPSRLHEGQFYALPQSPQIFKQLLMLSGFDRYYQVARCFRDEDLRSDRQPEFTQVDMEMSFMSKEEIIDILEELFRTVFKEVLDVDAGEFVRMSYQDAMDTYGIDRPDMRFGLEIVDVTDILGDSDFKVFVDAVKDGGVVRSINIKGGNNLTRNQINELTDKAIQWGAGGMAWIAIDNDGNLRTILDKFISDEKMAELFDRMDVENGDMLIFGSDDLDTVRDTLGKLRLEIGHMTDLIDEDQYKFVTVVDFPLFEYNDDRLVAMHHPFTRYVEEDKELLYTDPLAVRAESYDIVLNGIELGSGSLRIYDPEIQAEMFSLLGLDEQEVKDRFGFLIDAFQYGTPPHGGFAFGLDRLVMLMTGDESIREVIAFPKNRYAQCPLTDAPSTVDTEQLTDLGIGLLGNEEFINQARGERTSALDMEQLGDLSELNIDSDEYKEFIEKSMKDLEELKDLDLSDYEPMINPSYNTNAFRDDTIVRDFEREEILSVTETTDSGEILVPRVVEE